MVFSPTSNPNPPKIAIFIRPCATLVSLALAKPSRHL